MFFSKQLLIDGDSVLMQPIMRLQVVVPDEYSQAVMADLSRRRAEVQNVGMRGRNKVLTFFLLLLYL